METFYSIFVMALGIVQCCGHDGPLSVFDGGDATEGEFPYMVSLRLGIGEHNCGGSIIGPTWVLAAGHCLRLDTVRYGTIRLDNYQNDPNCTVAIKKYHAHPDFQMIRVNWTWGYIVNDIALYELEEPLPYGPNVEPVKLAAKDQVLPYNKLGNFTGWGYTDLNNHIPDKLKKVSLAAFEPDYCIENSMDLYRRDGTNICAGSDKKGRGVCYEDSGGPLVVDGVQYGVLSWMTVPCGGPVVGFSSVAHFRDWIRNVTGI